MFVFGQNVDNISCNFCQSRNQLLFDFWELSRDSAGQFCKKALYKEAGMQILYKHKNPRKGYENQSHH
ncbi:hypothetical protein CH352_17440 [Leptospira hartskeerlii]|nr:hypothetical protein CH352_17440 [Leptospira hartskeerlii]